MIPLNHEIVTGEIKTSPRRTGDFETPYIKIFINEQPYNACIDTGASLNVVSYRLYEHLKNSKVEIMSLPTSNLVCRVAIGKGAQPIKLQCLLTIKIEGELFDIIFLVIRNLNSDVILGCTFFEEHNVLVDFERRITYITNGNKKIACNFIAEQYVPIEMTEEEQDIGETELFVQQVPMSTGTAVMKKLVLTNEASVQSFHAETGFGKETTIPSEGNGTEAEKLNNLREVCQNAYNLDDSQRQKLFQVLHDNREVFSDLPGTCNVYEHRFEVEGIQPYRHKYDNLPLSLREPAKKVVQDMLRCGVISKCRSEVMNSLKRANSRACAKKLIENYIKDIGEVRAILTDNATIFTGKVFTEKVREAKIKHYHCSRYNPSANSSERAIKELGIHLRIMCHHRQTKWIEMLAPLERLYNETVNAVTGFKPIEIIQGKLQKTIKVNVPPPIQYSEAQQLEIQEIHRIALEKIRKAAERRRKKYEEKKKGIVWEPEEGTEVLLRNKQLSNKAQKRNRRLLLYYTGPYTISRKYGTDTFELIDVATNKIIGRYHKRLLKPYHRQT